MDIGLKKSFFCRSRKLQIFAHGFSDFGNFRTEIIGKYLYNLMQTKVELPKNVLLYVFQLFAIKYVG